MGGPTSSDYLLMLRPLIPQAQRQNKYAHLPVYWRDQTQSPWYVQKTDQLPTETEVPAKTQDSKQPKWIAHAFKEAVTLSRHISMSSAHVIHRTNIHNKCIVMDLIMKGTHAVGWQEPLWSKIGGGKTDPPYSLVNRPSHWIYSIAVCMWNDLINHAVSQWTSSTLNT